VPAKQPAKVAYSIAHSIPGRVRFRVPRIVEDPKYAQRLEASLEAEPTVIKERINRLTGSITITYKSPLKHNTQKPDRKAAISHLASLLENATDVALA
jgi:Heavy metal associated domain 2